MKKGLQYFGLAIIMSALLSYWQTEGLNSDYLTMFGLINLIIGILGLLVGTIFSIARKDEIAKGLLIASSLLLLMGILTCSAFPFRLN
jgi:hypothetical protein